MNRKVLEGFRKGLNGKGESKHLGHDVSRRSLTETELGRGWEGGMWNLEVVREMGLVEIVEVR